MKDERKTFIILSDFGNIDKVAFHRYEKWYQFTRLCGSPTLLSGSGIEDGERRLD